MYNLQINYLITPLLDWVIAALWLVIAYVAFVQPLQQRHTLPEPVRRLVPYAWLARVGGAFFTYYLYLFYYGGGDIINYINDATNLTKSFFLRPGETVTYLLHSILRRDYLDYINTTPEFYWFWVANGIWTTYAYDAISNTVSALTMPFALAALGSVNGTIVLFSTFSFYTSFTFFASLHKVYPTSWEKTAIPILFLPSVLSWIALPFKEAYALLFLLYAIRKLFLEPFRPLVAAFAVLLLYFAYIVKPYIIISMIPILGLIIVQSMGARMRSNFLLYALYFLAVVPVLGLTFYILSIAAESSGKYSFDTVTQQAYLVYLDLTRNEMYYTETGGSVYDIGEFDPTIGGMLSKFPIALFTGLFRPFLWEAKKAIILLSALENTALLLFTFWGLWRYGGGQVLRAIIGHRWSRSFMIFAIFFTFMMGLTSGNFGNLVRYRVPGLFFFYIVIFATYGALGAKASDSRRRE